MTVGKMNGALLIFVASMLDYLKLIKMEDVISPCGAFYHMAWDQAIMFPMLEMSGHRAKFHQ
jgi:hypothetical protein